MSYWKGDSWRPGMLLVRLPWWFDMETARNAYQLQVAHPVESFVVQLFDGLSERDQLTWHELNKWVKSGSARDYREMFEKVVEELPKLTVLSVLRSWRYATMEDMERWGFSDGAIFAFHVFAALVVLSLPAMFLHAAVRSLI